MIRHNEALRMRGAFWVIVRDKAWKFTLVVEN